MNDWSSYQVDSTSSHPKGPSRIEPGQGLGRGKGRAARYNRDAILASYKRSQSITQDMKEFGCSEMTARRALKQMGVEFKSKGGRPRPKFCGRGHDQKKWGKKDKRGWHYCYKCHSERNAEYAKKQKENNA